MLDIREALAKLNVVMVDLNCWLGGRLAGHGGELGLDETISALRHCGIQTAVLTHLLCYSYDSLEGNSRLLKEIESLDNVYGALVLDPAVAVSTGEVRDYLSNAIREKARVVRLSIKSSFWSLPAEFHKNFYSALCDFRLPVMLNLEEFEIADKTIDWRELHEVVRQLDRCPLIITTSQIKELYYMKHLYSLMQAYENVRLETSNLMLFGIIEDIVERFGADRLVFGSNFPVYDPSAAISQVLFANLDRGEKRKILGLNALEMLEPVGGISK